tara:strand:- start:579 stop:743 length:165 start_codon:yes stop_codon:yes gene_type:complete
MFYCLCGEEFKVSKKFVQCDEEGSLEIVEWKCKLCGYTIISDKLEKERGWEGLR